MAIFHNFFLFLEQILHGRIDLQHHAAFQPVIDDAGHDRALFVQNDFPFDQQSNR